MASRKTSLRTNRGFSLIEILVVIGIFAIVGGFTAAIGYDSYRAGALYTEQDALVSALQKARSESMNNIDEVPHGVAVFPASHPNSYVIFEGRIGTGVDYSNLHYTDPNIDHDKDEIIDSTYPVTASTSLFEVAFEQLSGNSNYSGDIGLRDPRRGFTATTSINYEGRISR